MTSKERVKRAMQFRPVDKVPVQYCYSDVGFYEHGEKLNDLYEAYPGDFEPFVRRKPPILPTSSFDVQGNYHAFRDDEWGVKWEYRIYGIAGIPCRRPINAPEDMDTYALPAAPALEGSEYEQYARYLAEKNAQGYYTLESSGSLYERLISLYGDENVLCDIVLEEPEIARLADRIIDHSSAYVQRALKAGADCIAFGDDYGTERAMIMDPVCWRKFFSPDWRSSSDRRWKRGERFISIAVGR